MNARNTNANDHDNSEDVELNDIKLDNDETDNLTTSNQHEKYLLNTSSSSSDSDSASDFINLEISKITPDIADDDDIHVDDNIHLDMITNTDIPAQRKAYIAPISPPPTLNSYLFSCWSYTQKALLYF